MTTLNAFVDRCWDEHASDPAGVAERMHQALPLVQEDADVARLAMLVHHVFGEHLGKWDRGVSFLNEISALSVPGDAGPAAVARCRTSLQLCDGGTDRRAEMSPSEACRVTVMAACSLAPYATDRSSRYLEEATARADDLPNEDGAVRTLASFANNMAGSLQEKAELDDDERRLMLRAAEVARKNWERAGTWLEVERAEYRLAACWLVAGDGERSLEHARLCDEIVQANGAEPLEVFFAAEVLGMAAQFSGDQRLVSNSVRAAESAFAALGAEDQPWCKPTLEKLRGLGNGTRA